ncbi:MAG: TspO/MBR family protein, partial [Christensenella sp.]|uniref:TspO/MBR family protein n=1 Tax=Christensenella sp. TaxID=1935934 RepID=UPI002B1FD0CF
EGSGLALMSLKTDSPWFLGLTLSPVHPPYVVFGIVWTTLYVLMGCSFVISILNPKMTKGVHIGYILNIFLGAMWSPAFFLLKSPLAGLLVAVATLVNAAILLRNVWKVSHEASYMIIPYLVWIAFATYLNAAIIALN